MQHLGTAHPVSDFEGRMLFSDQAQSAFSRFYWDEPGRIKSPRSLGALSHHRFSDRPCQGFIRSSLHIR